jgi:ribonuclease Z
MREHDLIEVDVLNSVSAIGTQILLTHNKTHALVDVGDGTVRDLVSRHVDFNRIEAVLLTHEHFDHFSGLYGILHFCRLQRRQEALVLIVPRPSKVVRYLLQPPVMYEPLPFEVRLTELEEEENIAIGGFDVTSFAVKHGSANAFGYSVQDKEGFRVVLSGDTQLCASLEQSVKGADIAVLEATYSDDYEELSSKYGHMTISQARALGKSAKETILIHSSPEYYFRKFQCAIK